MMDCLWLGLTLTVLLGPMDEQAAVDWQPFMSKEGRFTISMPGNPLESTKKVGTATGHLDVKVFVAEGNDKALFVVSYCDFPAKDLKDGPIEARLDQARDGAVASIGGKLRSEKAIKLAGHQGRDLVIEKDGVETARLRLVLVKNRLYQVMALGPASKKDRARFFESFRLSK